MKKLTLAQQEVVELLRNNKGSYIIKNIAPKVWSDKIYIGYTFTNPTFNAILRLNIIKPTDQKDIYVLSEKE